MVLKVTKTESNAILPTRKYSLDAGLDLYSVENVIIEPNKVAVVNTGIAVELPPNTMGWITNKSRSMYLVGAGVVDEGYTGNLLVKIFNPTDKHVIIKPGDAIAQLVILPIVRPDILLVDHIEETSERKRDGGISRNE